MGCSVKDTFYVDPRVEGCDGLSSRAKRLGLQLRGFLGEGVTVCVAATSSSSSSSSSSGGAGRGIGGNEGAGDETVGAGAGLSRGQRLSRIHRMARQVMQAQTEPTARSGSGVVGRLQRQDHTCITDQARQLRATVLSGKAFSLWLDRQESKRGAARGDGAVGAAAGGGEKGETPARQLISRGPGAATSRFKSQEHPRVVMKDLDGLEPDRVQAFPPELWRKCNLHTDAPPGMCPFIPREQWDREVLKMKKKDALCGAIKAAAKMPPSGAQKPRRGGWCECCERQYIGTMSEHCAGDQHRAAVAADPNYAVLLELESWTSSDAENGAQTVAHAPTPVASEEVISISSSSSTAAVAGAVEVGAGGGSTSMAEARVASATNGRDDERERSLAPAAERDVSPGGRDDATKPAAAAGRASPSQHARGFSSPTRGDVVNAKQETSTREDTAPRDAVSPSEIREVAGAGTGVRVLRSSPRRYPKPEQQASFVPCSEAAEAAAGGGEGGEGASPRAATSEEPRPGSLKRSRRSDAISSHEVRKGGGCANTGMVAGTPPQQSTTTKRRTRSSPLACSSSTPEYLCTTTELDNDASELRKCSGGAGSPAAATADTPATSVLSNPSSQSDCSKRTNSSSSSSSNRRNRRKKARCPSESPPACTQSRDGAYLPPSSRRAGRNSRRLVTSPRSSCKRDTAGSRSGTASPAVGAEMVRRNPRASHVEAGSSTPVFGDSGTRPSGRADNMDTAAQKHSPIHSAPCIAGGKPERVSLPSPLSDAERKDDDVKLEKKRARVLKMLADSPDFRGGGASFADSTSRLRTCDSRGRSVTTTGSGSRRCSRDHRGGDGSATKANSSKARRPNNRGAPSGGSTEEEWRVKKKRKRRNDDEFGGGPSTDSGSPCESGTQAVGAVGGKIEQAAETASGGSKSARARRRRGCASSPDDSREEEGSKSASSPVRSDGDKDSSSSSSRSRGGTRTHSKRRAPSTTSRMGLATAGDSSDGGDGSAEDPSQQSSPLSSKRHRSVLRSLCSKFAEHHGDPTSPAGRRKHSPVGANSNSGSSGKRARVMLPKSPRRIRA